MPKHGFLTPKAIGNRIKSRGLQKLRWYCQVCSKQCRDENGFKCHTNSDNHQRQMLIVASNPLKVMANYSSTFEAGFMACLRQRHTTTRVRANLVYNEYIADKNHIHMNATRWTTLSGFVQYLASESKVIAEEEERGWYITYIDRDPRKIAKAEEWDKKQKRKLDHEARNRHFLKQQMDAAKPVVEEVEKEFKRLPGNEKISLSMTGKVKASSKKSTLVRANVLGSEDTDSQSVMTKDAPCKKRVFADVSSDLPPTKRLQNWLCKNIVVKIVTKALGAKYYKQKGNIVQVENQYVAHVHVLGSIVRVDQDDLETVVPMIGHPVQIVNGTARGCHGKLVALKVQEFCASIEITSEKFAGQVLDKVEYEDFSKLAS